MEIRCAVCSNEQAALCLANFSIARTAIERSAERTANDGWRNYTFKANGEVAVETVEGYSEDAMFGQQMVRSMIVFSLMHRQSDLDCSLTRDLIEQRLVIES